MKSSLYQELAEPWRRWPRIFGRYAIVWIIGATTLTGIRLLFDERRPPVPVQSIDTKPTGAVRPLVPELPQAVSQGSDIQVADSGSSVELIASLLEKNSQYGANSIDEYAENRGFKNQYPLGFAIFYSDGKKITAYQVPPRGNISFDLTNLKVTFQSSAAGSYVSICMNLLPVDVGGRQLRIVHDSCFVGTGHVIHAAQIDDVSIDVVALGSGPNGAAWLIGMRH